MIEIIKRQDVIKRFGSPGDQSQFVRKSFPFTMEASWDKAQKITSFYGHSYIADAVIAALEEIKKYYGIDFIKDAGLNSYGGCFSDRTARGSEQRSIHSWGLAVDYIPEYGKFGSPAITPHIVVAAFKKQGFLWGGDWSSPDGMHWSCVEE